ncbi:DUF6932 family protein [Arthrobacter sp. KNU40]|uniref:DUF6932 family protein n=1 Tax=Arthrobacter sp. KNU40 TaxID=3447965 RepID=UPI003F5D8969
MGQTTDERVPDVSMAGILHAIPPLDSVTGHLPPGRYRTTLGHIRHRFVDHSQFSGSTTRPEIWDGFLSYLTAWDETSAPFGQPILHTLWVAGSFISDELNPGDIDVSPVYDEGRVSDLASTQGIGKVKALVGHRKKLVEKYKVEPFPIPWRSLETTLLPTTLLDHEQDYLAKRGGLDDWWQRVRPAGPRAASLAPDVSSARGYLEVTW